MKLIRGDCLDVMRAMPDDSVDLVFTSPPYENARKYGELDFSLSGQAWVDWAVERYAECVRVCRGLVAWVVAGRTRKFQWSATPALLMADLHRAGVQLRNPPIYAKTSGIPGSGGPDWWRNDYELIICSSKGKLPWSDNTATGGPCKYPTGGQMSNRSADGRRANERRGYYSGGSTTQRHAQNARPVVANPGNIIKVSPSNLGSKLAHENEAPFPMDLVEPFVKSFCAVGGTVLDPFVGSGTTGEVALRNGREFIGIDTRESQIELATRRLV